MNRNNAVAIAVGALLVAGAVVLSLTGSPGQTYYVEAYCTGDGANAYQPFILTADDGGNVALPNNCVASSQFVASTITVIDGGISQLDGGQPTLPFGCACTDAPVLFSTNAPTGVQNPDSGHWSGLRLSEQGTVWHATGKIYTHPCALLAGQGDIYQSGYCP